jgi:hypothetical protein
MSEPSQLTRVVMADLARILSGPPGPQTLGHALRHLAKWRSVLLEATLVARSGTKVLSGPFQGMDYPVRAAEGARAARLIGSYESSLAPVIEKIVARACPLVIDIGCAEGFYAVGLALRMPQARIMARDTSEKAQALCRALAEANHVAHRVEVGGEFTHADFALCRDRPAVVICDIEGAEDALLDPAAAPGLLSADILVEVHEGQVPGLLARLTGRFAATHRITRIDREIPAAALPDWAEELGDLDRLLMLWEWRAGPTPWLWMERKA